MTAATVTTKPEGVLAEDVVVLTATDGETYTSRLGKIYGVSATFNEDLGATAYPLYVAVSGRTVTIHAEGVTDKKVCLIIKGRL